MTERPGPGAYNTHDSFGQRSAAAGPRRFKPQRFGSTAQREGWDRKLVSCSFSRLFPLGELSSPRCQTHAQGLSLTFMAPYLSLSIASLFLTPTPTHAKPSHPFLQHRKPRTLHTAAHKTSTIPAQARMARSGLRSRAQGARFSSKIPSALALSPFVRVTSKSLTATLSGLGVSVGELTFPCPDRNN